MKFLLAAAFVTSIYTQKIVSISHEQVIQPPIQIYEDDVKKPKENIVIEKTQIKNGIQSPITSDQTSQDSIQTVYDEEPVEKSSQPQIQIKNDKVQVQQQINDQPISGPIPTPTPSPNPIPNPWEIIQEHKPVIDPLPQPVPPFTPQNEHFNKKKDKKHKKDRGHIKDHKYEVSQNQFNNPTKSSHHSQKDKKTQIDPFIIQPKHDEKKQKNERHKKKNLRQHKKNHQKQGKGQDFSVFQEYQPEQKHGRKQHRGGKNKNICFVFFLVGLISTIFGICLTKCLRKCKKNKNKKVVYVNRNMSSSQIAQQIAEKERKINELKEQYKNKKTIEDTTSQLRRQQQAASIAYETQMRKMEERRQQKYVQPNQRYAVIQNEHIPIGRPINSSANSSFACQYPQL